MLSYLVGSWHFPIPVCNQGDLPSWVRQVGKRNLGLIYPTVHAKYCLKPYQADILAVRVYTCKRPL
jgi:hypothetical protein